MKELLYKKSEAVAALNRVDGFHPMELARKIGEEGQEEQLYLDGLNVRILLCTAYLNIALRILYTSRIVFVL